MLKSLFGGSISSSISMESILICTLVSIVLGLIIALTHKITSKYSKNFLLTISILPVLVQVVIIMVNGNLGTSLAVAGTFSLVRFRSTPGTSKEILSVFFAMAVGLATGMGQVVLASIITVLVSLVIILFCKTKLFEMDKSEKILKIVVPENLNYTNLFDETFENFTKKANLEKVKTTNMGSLFELSYRVVTKSNINEKEFIDALRVKNGNLKVSLSLDMNDNDM